jgi:hypothetical protein
MYFSFYQLTIRYILKISNTWLFKIDYLKKTGTI